MGISDVNTAYEEGNRSDTASLVGIDSALEFSVENMATVGIQITGTWSGTIQFEATTNGTDWLAAPVYNQSGNSVVTSTISNAMWHMYVAGYSKIRTRRSPTASGTAVVHMISSPHNSIIKIASQGTNNVGVAAAQSGTWITRTADSAGDLVTSDTIGSKIFLNVMSETYLRRLTQLSKNFATTNNFTNRANTEQPFILITNPIGSGIIVTIYHISIGINIGGLNATRQGQFRYYMNPTITANGTGLTEVNLYNKSSPTAAIATAFLTPTISNNGTIFAARYSNDINGSLNEYLEDTIILDPGQSFLITSEMSANNTSVTANLRWTES